MNIWNNTSTLWLLACISSFGIVMMLLLDGIWDWVMLVVAILPLIIAIYRIYRF